MTEQEIADFVTRFVAAWAARDGKRFVELWHPEGLLHSPLYNRPIKGSEFERLTELVTNAAPDLVWQLLDWTWRPKSDGALVIIEWQSTRTSQSGRFDWRGVDKITLENGKIIEEIVYFDSAPLRARRAGTTLEALIAV